jgi:hypothetical protein
MKRTGHILAALCVALANVGVRAAEPPVVSANQLVDKTLNAIAFVQRGVAIPGGNGPTGGELARIMFQAYLGAGGRTLVRAWDATRDAYTPLTTQRWSLSGATLCLDVPLTGPQPICANIHIWGPRIAGVGAKPYAMLDGDLQPGNIIGRR